MTAHEGFGQRGAGWGAVTDDVLAIVESDPEDVPGVLERLDRLWKVQSRLPPRGPRDAAASFTYLYRDITARVLHGLEAGEFTDSPFLATLDVEFGRRYFAAVRAWARDPATAPRCWAALFSRQGDERATSLKAAVAGVNAHVNFDLAYALLATMRRVPGPAFSEVQHRDYLVVNDVFHQQIPRLRAEFYRADVFAEMMDRINGSIDDAVHDRLVRVTRGRAWSEARDLWRHRDEPGVWAAAESHLDRAVALLSDAIFSPGSDSVFDPTLWAHLGSVPMQDKAVGSLAEAIEGVRRELSAAIDAGRGQEVRFQVGEVTLEFEVEVTRSGGADGGLRLGVVSVGGRGEAGSSRAHRVRVSLTPVGVNAEPSPSPRAARGVAHGDPAALLVADSVLDLDANIGVADDSPGGIER